MNGDTRTQLLTEALRRNSTDVFRYLERRLGQRESADALADVMTTAWKRVDSLPQEEEATRMWLFGIARHIAANAERSEVRKWRLAERLRMALLTAPHQSNAADEGDEVRDAIAQLTPDLAEIIRLIHWDGFTAVEAAQIIGIPASTARGRYQRARQELKTILIPGRLTRQ